MLSEKTKGIKSKFIAFLIGSSFFCWKKWPNKVNGSVVCSRKDRKFQFDGHWIRIEMFSVQMDISLIVLSAHSLWLSFEHIFRFFSWFSVGSPCFVRNRKHLMDYGLVRNYLLAPHRHHHSILAICRNETVTNDDKRQRSRIKFYRFAWMVNDNINAVLSEPESDIGDEGDFYFSFRFRHTRTSNVFVAPLFCTNWKCQPFTPITSSTLPSYDDTMRRDKDEAANDNTME